MPFNVENNEKHSTCTVLPSFRDLNPEDDRDNTDHIMIYITEKHQSRSLNRERDDMTVTLACIVFSVLVSPLQY